MHNDRALSRLHILPSLRGLLVPTAPVVVKFCNMDSLQMSPSHHLLQNCVTATCMVDAIPTFSSNLQVELSWNHFSSNVLIHVM